MGYALHGNDISTDTDPFEARLGWAVAMDKGDFRGREALAARKEVGPKRQLVGLLSADRLIPRHGMPVLDGDRPVGEVTSGTFSPPCPGRRPGHFLPDVSAKDTPPVRRPAAAATLLHTTSFVIRRIASPCGP